MRIKPFFLLLIWFISQFSCTSDGKINGISFVASRNGIGTDALGPVLDSHANWAAVMPFGFMRGADSPEIIYNHDRQWWGERKDGAKKTTELLQAKGIQVMVKPQIWMRGGTFTGTITMKNEEDWKRFEESYRDFMLLYARMAEETGAGILCLGTELQSFVKHRPSYWSELITAVREVYSGKLTYAENWDSYAEVPFWKELDYIGIDAYFPLSEEKTPGKAELAKNWQSYKKEMAALATATGKPILFTEYGYRSVDYTARRPWDFDHGAAPNMEGQVNALQAVYEEFWKEEWFAGGFLWKWFDNHDRAGGLENDQFTPQNKPAQSVVTDFYKSMKE